MSSNNFRQVLIAGACLGMFAGTALAADAVADVDPAVGVQAQQAAPNVGVVTIEQDKLLAKETAPVKFASPAQGSASSEIAEIQMQTAVLQAKAAHAKASAELEEILHPKEEKKAEPVAMPGMPGAVQLGPDGQPMPVPPIPVIEKEKPVEMPALMAIYGRPGNYLATLRLASGVVLDVRAGDPVAKGVTVKSVSASRVVLETTKESKEYTLRALAGK